MGYVSSTPERPLSLKDRSSRRLAAALFKKSNILASLSNFHSKFSHIEVCGEKDWQETVEDKLLDEISKFGLPKSLTELLTDTVKRMGRLVGRWKEFHEEYLRYDREEEIYFDAPILEKLCWTAAGTVDYRKTAEELIRSDVVDVVKRYKLACLYCMEYYILMSWKELPKENKQHFRDSSEDRFLRFDCVDLEFWWPYIIEGQESKLEDLTRPFRVDEITVHQYAFQCSAEKGNIAATEYFLQKLAHEEKEASLMSATRAIVEPRYTTRSIYDNEFPSEKFSELISYLLSIMTPDQQMLIFQEHPYQVLEWFLVWTLQDIFLETAEVISHFLAEEDHDFLLWIIHGNFKDSDHYCLKLFQELFNCISREFWKNFVDLQCKFGSFFDFILMEQDIKALAIFLRSVVAATRTRLVLSEPALKTYHDCISIGKWGVVEVCLQGASLSQEEKERLKEGFLKCLTWFEKVAVMLKTQKWSRFFHLVDKMNDTNRSRSEDMTPSETK